METIANNETSGALTMHDLMPAREPGITVKGLNELYAEYRRLCDSPVYQGEILARVARNLEEAIRGRIDGTG